MLREMIEIEHITCFREWLTESNPVSTIASVSPKSLRERSSVVSVSARSSLIGTSPKVTIEKLPRTAAASCSAPSPSIPF